MINRVIILNLLLFSIVNSKETPQLKITGVRGGFIYGYTYLKDAVNDAFDNLYETFYPRYGTISENTHDASDPYGFQGVVTANYNEMWNFNLGYQRVSSYGSGGYEDMTLTHIVNIVYLSAVLGRYMKPEKADLPNIYGGGGINCWWFTTNVLGELGDWGEENDYNDIVYSISDEYEVSWHAFGGIERVFEKIFSVSGEVWYHYPVRFSFVINAGFLFNQ